MFHQTLQAVMLARLALYTGADPGIRRGGFYHTHSPKTTPQMTHLRGGAHILRSSLGDCTADLSSRLEERVSASSVSVCWYVASFRKGGSSKPNELPLNPPLLYSIAWLDNIDHAGCHL